MTPGPHPFCTIGHSDRTAAEFIEVLQGADIDFVVDVRRLPGSGRHPQFNEDVLGASLAAADIGFMRAEALTGRRPVSHDVDFEVNGWWHNRSFHNYADHALSAEFDAALTDVQVRGRDQRIALMCAEAVWWRCHRRIIADHLIARGEKVLHIMGAGRLAPAELSEGAVVQGGSVSYPTQDAAGS